MSNKELKDVPIRPLRLTNEEHADLKRAAQLANQPINEYVSHLVRWAMGENFHNVTKRS